MVKAILSVILLTISLQAYADEAYADDKWLDGTGISDISDCDGHSQSFTKSCEEYVDQLNKEQKEPKKKEHEYEEYEQEGY